MLLKLWCATVSLLFVALFLPVAAADKASQAITDEALRRLVHKLPKDVCKKIFYMAEEQGDKIFTGIKPGSLLDYLTPCLDATEAGRLFLNRCECAKHKRIDSPEVGAMCEAVEKIDKSLHGSLPAEISAFQLMQRVRNSFGYTIMPGSCDKRMVFNRLFSKPRKSACQKFNDFVVRVFDRLNS